METKHKMSAGFLKLDAIDTYKKTGLTPSQLEEQRADLLGALLYVEAVLTEAREDGFFSEAQGDGILKRVRGVITDATRLQPGSANN